MAMFNYGSYRKVKLTYKRVCEKRTLHKTGTWYNHCVSHYWSLQCFFITKTNWQKLIFFHQFICILLNSSLLSLWRRISYLHHYICLPKTYMNTKIFRFPFYCEFWFIYKPTFTLRKPQYLQKQ